MNFVEKHTFGPQGVCVGETEDNVEEVVDVEKVVDVEEVVDVKEVVDVEEIVDVEEVADPDMQIYVSSLLGPPQYSNGLPSHCILQLAVVELVLPFSKTFPQ